MSNKKNKKRKKKKTDFSTLAINHSLFNFIKALNNDCFANMKGLDLQELLYHMDSYYLTLRRCLGLIDQVTFGLEIEAEEACRHLINDMIEEKLSSWKVKGDSSLDEGVEINSPILDDQPNYWNQVKEACQIIAQNSLIGEKSGGHIHIGAHILGEKVKPWLNFIKLWSVYENVIYRFSYGEFLEGRPAIKRYAISCAQLFWSGYQKCSEFSSNDLQSLLRVISQGRYQAVNFTHVESDNCKQENNTIEFRCPNGTLDPIIWQNNVNVFAHMLLYAKNTRYDDDMIEKRRLINSDDAFGLDLYNEVYLQQALELSDMLFTNNLDKVYFLKQYLKSFQVSNKPLERAKTFTKNT